MSKIAFSPADILLPFDCGLTKWAVVACDQYTSQPEYWERVDQFVGDAPSTLRLILPESKLESDNVEEEIKKINETMEQYLEEERLRPIENSFIFLERKLHNGKTRLGLVGKLDLEQYSYEKGSGTPIRATEGTVLSRIPPRMKVRKNAPIELPHIMVLIDDPDKQIIEPLQSKENRKKMQMLYSATLMEQGGRVSGYRLDQKQNDEVMDKLTKLADPQRFAQFYHAEGKPVLTFAMGDGNHSLATAKACWEELKATLPEAERETHPARYALVELVNLHDDSLEFEAIHRVLFDVDPQKLLDDFLAAYPGAHYGEGEGHVITYVHNGEKGVVTVPNPTAQLAVGTLQSFLDRYLEENGGKIDYIHGEDVVDQLTAQPNSIGFLLPSMGKDQLFPTVIFDGALPRKTFSMGEAHDKRFYLEARKIK
ncbi:MAG: DUF1015 domain-containing protein [Evtepia sp.]|uniref:DUF1015 domain-containing protein n=1 Tax=Evtepia sp. TaxID=2773933 RepID=UPI002A760D4C|nr:DUF1015 domain-containing protein [Evtepia sp.]MDY3014476.1 DUF1015 domain-containing protein [Evtepia sp.]